MTNIKEIPLMDFGISPLFSKDGSKKERNYQENTLNSLTHGILSDIGVRSDIKKAYGNVKQLIESEFGMENLEVQRANGLGIEDKKLINNRGSFFTAITSLAQNLSIRNRGATPLNNLFFELVGHSNTNRWDSGVEKSIIEANSDLQRLVDTLNKYYNEHLPKGLKNEVIHIPMEFVRDTVLKSDEMKTFRSTLRELRMEARTYGLAEKVFSHLDKDKALKTKLNDFFVAYTCLEALVLNGDKHLGKGLSPK